MPSSLRMSTSAQNGQTALQSVRSHRDQIDDADRAVLMGSREMREQLHRWLQQQKKDNGDQQKLESLKLESLEAEKSEEPDEAQRLMIADAARSDEPEDQLKRKNMFQDDSSEDESKKTPAADSSDEDGPPKKKKIMVDEEFGTLE